MRLEHHLVGGYVRYISPHIIIIIIILLKENLWYNNNNNMWTYSYIAHVSTN